jgi:hypothetical protein
METRYKTVKVSLVHYNELSELGEMKDTFDKVIGRLLEAIGWPEEVGRPN